MLVLRRFKEGGEALTSRLRPESAIHLRAGIIGEADSVLSRM